MKIKPIRHSTATADMPSTSPAVNDVLHLDGDVLRYTKTFRDIREFLLFPIFSLAKRPDTDIYPWRSPDKTKAFTVTPSEKGRATLWDADIIIYLATVIYLMSKAGTFKPVNGVITSFALTTSDLLRFKSMHSGGGDYSDLISSFDRLQGTRFNFEHDASVSNMPLIQEYRIERDEKGRSKRIIVKPSEWLYKLIVDPRKMLDISQDYLKITKPFERQLYRIARCMAGDKECFRISTKKLWTWCGSHGKLKQFRHHIKRTDPVVYFSYIHLIQTDYVHIINNILFNAREKRYVRKMSIEKQKRLKAGIQ